MAVPAANDPIAVDADAAVAALALPDSRMGADGRSSEWLLYTVSPASATLPFCFETTPRNNDPHRSHLSECQSVQSLLPAPWLLSVGYAEQAPLERIHRDSASSEMLSPIPLTGSW